MLSIDLGIRQAVIRLRPKYTCKNLGPLFDAVSLPTDLVSCNHLLCSFLSRIMLTEVTINQWCDDTLTCYLSVN